MFGSCTRKEIEIEIMANGEIAFYFLYCKLELWNDTYFVNDILVL